MNSAGKIIHIHGAEKGKKLKFTFILVIVGLKINYTLILVRFEGENLYVVLYGNYFNKVVFDYIIQQI